MLDKNTSALECLHCANWENEPTIRTEILIFVLDCNWWLFWDFSNKILILNSRLLNMLRRQMTIPMWTFSFLWNHLDNISVVFQWIEESFLLFVHKNLSEHDSRKTSLKQPDQILRLIKLTAPWQIRSYNEEMALFNGSRKWLKM